MTAQGPGCSGGSPSYGLIQGPPCHAATKICGTMVATTLHLNQVRLTKSPSMFEPQGSKLPIIIYSPQTCTTIIITQIARTYLLILAGKGKLDLFRV